MRYPKRDIPLGSVFLVCVLLIGLIMSKLLTPIPSVHVFFLFCLWGIGNICLDGAIMFLLSPKEPPHADG